jgi:alkylhydroperoxidase family enzyme
VTVTGWPIRWDELTALARESFAGYTELHRMIDSSVDPVIVELCRLRIVGLVGAHAQTSWRRPSAIAAGLTEAKISALADWPSSPLFTAAERACLAFAELFCMGAFTISDADVSAMLEHLDADQCYAFVNGVWVVEAMARMAVVMGVDPDPQALGLVPRAETELAR